MRYLALLSVTCVIAFLCGGCSTEKALDRTYLTEAKTIRPIAVPAGVPAPVNAPYYAIPNVPVSAANQPVSIVPPGSNLAAYSKSNKSAKSQSMSNQAMVQQSTPNQTAASASQLPPPS